MPTGSLRGHRRVAVGVFAAVVAVSAYAGAVGLVTGGLAIGAGVDQLPLGPLPGGVTLAVAVGAPATWLAWLAWRGDARTDAAALICGALLIGWIGVELVVAREVTVLHTARVLVGAVLIEVGRRGSGEPPGPVTDPSRG